MTTIKSIAKAYSVATSTSFMQLADFMKSLSKEEKTLCKGKTSEIREELDAIKNAKSKKDTAKKLSISVKKLAEIERKAYQIAKQHSGCTGYSMGDLVTVEVRYTYRKKDNKIGSSAITLASYSCMQEYSKSSKYRAKHGSLTITLTVGEIEVAELIGGVLTIIALEKGKISKCKYFEIKGSKHQISTRWVEGFITSGFHAESYEACVSWRKLRKASLFAQRQREAISKMSPEEKAILLERAKSRFVGYQHSRNAGNCHTGTMAFAQRHNLNPKYGYQLGYILSLEDTSYTRRLQNLFV